MALCLPLSALLSPCHPLPLAPLLFCLVLPLFSSPASSSAASTYVDLLLFDIMAKYCIANIFVLLGLASGLAWPGSVSVPLCLSPSLPISLSLGLVQFLVSFASLLCSALFRRLCQSQSCEAHLTNELCSCYPPLSPSPSRSSRSHTIAIKCVNFLADNRFYFWHGAWHNPKRLQPCGMYVKLRCVCVLPVCVYVCGMELFLLLLCVVRRGAAAAWETRLQLNNLK